MSCIVKNSLRLVRATKNITSNTTTFQRSMWQMANRSYDSIHNSIELTKAHNFNSYQCKRLQHILADGSKEACKLKLPEYKPKDDKKKSKNNARRKTQKLKDNKLFASVDDNGEMTFKTIKGHEMFTADINELQFTITKDVLKKLQNEINAEKKTPKAKKNELIKYSWRLTFLFIGYYIIKNSSSFSEHVYEENGLRPVHDIFTHVI